MLCSRQAKPLAFVTVQNALELFITNLASVDLLTFRMIDREKGGGAGYRDFLPTEMGHGDVSVAISLAMSQVETLLRL